MTNSCDTIHLPLKTTFLIPNLYHSPSISIVDSVLESFGISPYTITFSVVANSLTIHHDTALPTVEVASALRRGGFEIDETFEEPSLQAQTGQTHTTGQNDSLWAGRCTNVLHKWTIKNLDATESEESRSAGIEFSPCELCRAEKDGHITSPLAIAQSSQAEVETGLEEKVCTEKASEVEKPNRQDKSSPPPFVVVDTPELFNATFMVEGMTCSSCTGAISRVLDELPFISTVDVSLLTNSASVTFYNRDHIQDIIDAIEDVGFDATLNQVTPLSSIPLPKDVSDFWQADYTVSGMTCSSCAVGITDALEKLDFVDNAAVNFVAGTVNVSLHDKTNLSRIRDAIEELGFEAVLVNVPKARSSANMELSRTVDLQVTGMYCGNCPSRLLDSLKRDFGNKIKVEIPLTLSNPILKICYTPQAPDFTIRHIIDSLTDVDPIIKLSIYHPPTLEERSRKIQVRKRRHVLLRLALALVAAIPTFIIGIVLLDLLPSTSSARRFVMRPIWAGQATRADWALFITATPVYFFAADAFHRPALHELKALWRRGSRTPIFERFYRFGSMNTLISLGTTIAYVSSIAELAVKATHSQSSMGNYSSYFDSVVFLTMFLLIGRFLEAYSKAKTGDAVLLLSKLRPTTTILASNNFADTGDMQTGASGCNNYRTSIDMVEVGDIVKVLNGDSPPFDGVVVYGTSRFDESSLTGESRLVKKDIGDEVFSGSVNRAGPITIRISSVSGTSMLDQIVKVVREGQTKRAPIERVADKITSRFVPVVTLFAICTWLVWIALGLSNTLPKSYLNGTVGGWSVWSLQFAIAVFVVACPCGIGLAAPTALFVGGGLAARYGLLVKGGGEAFQEASNLDCVVFDKTGTLTQGSEPDITDYRHMSQLPEQQLLSLARSLEENSSHPLAKAIVLFCERKAAVRAQVSDVEELAGKGIRGRYQPETDADEPIDVMIGNEAFMEDKSVLVPEHILQELGTWKSQGKSVMLLALCANALPPGEKDVEGSFFRTWKLAAVFAASDTVRSDANDTVRAIQRRGIQVWMISGDNETTARAVGQMVGISVDHIIAGVLPHQKAERIQYLQKTLQPQRRGAKHAVVAMVGDGINDSPALTMADVGIAIGSGSDIAISSADFVLLSSKLFSLLTLIDLSRVVFRRVKFNFGWALVYNLMALPIAAGVLYPIVSNGSHIRLAPAWASLAMALSSVSVVCSSLLLKTELPLVGFRPRLEHAVV